MIPALIPAFVQNTLNKKTHIEEHTKSILNEAIRINEEHNYFNTLSGTLALEQAKHVRERIEQGEQPRLAGVPISIKDNICVKGIQTTAGSHILTGYKPVFNATVVQKLIDAGAVIIGKTSQDEFGFGSFSTNTGIGMASPVHPLDKTRVCGGSSGGAAGWTRKTNHVHAAIVESTGGSIVNPASFCGVVGLCPTYGRISRYGLIDYASSLDKIGIMTRTVQDAAIILEAVAGHDPKDNTSSQQPVDAYTRAQEKNLRDLRIGVLTLEGINPAVKQCIEQASTKLEQAGAVLTPIDLPVTKKYSIAAYYVLAMAEASTNLAKYCGMRYGLHKPITKTYEEYTSNIRQEGFGPEAKRRVLLGTFTRMAGYRDAYFSKASKVRTLVIQEYLDRFKTVDLILSPAMPFPAPTRKQIGELSPLQTYLADILTVGPNLAGLPHISVPMEEPNGLPVGAMLTAKHFDEKTMLHAGCTIE